MPVARPCSLAHARGPAPARAWLATLAAGLLLAACGGGDDPAPATPQAITVSGVAAVGAPLPGAAVSLRCADASNASATADTQGRWSTTVPAGAFPCLARATLAGTVLHAALATAADATTARMNITPLTELLLTQLAGQAAAGFFDAPRYAAVTAAAIDTALVALRSQLPAALASGLGNDNPVTVAFSANGAGHDALLDGLQAAFTAAGTTLGEVSAALAQGSTGGSLLPSHLPATALSATVGQALTLAIAGRPLPAGEVSVSFGTAAVATGTVSADGLGLTVTVPTALAGVPAVTVAVTGVRGAAPVTLSTPAAEPGTGGGGTTTPPAGGPFSASGTLQVSGGPAGVLFGPLPSSYTPTRFDPRHLGMAVGIWNTAAEVGQSWNLSIGSLVITSVHGPSGAAFQSSVLLGRGALRTAGVTVDLVNGSVRFSNVTLNRSAGASGSLVLDGSLTVPAQTGTALVFGGDGRSWVGAGMDAPAAAGVDSAVGSATKTTHTWTSALGTEVSLAITRLNGAINNTQLQVTSAFGSAWIRTVNGATLPEGLTLDAAAKSVRFDNVSLPDNGLGGGLFLTGTLPIQ